MADISISGVTKKFGELTAVSNLSLDIANGEFVVLLGPTGAGKTTTLRLVAGLEKADQGKVLIDGVDMTGEPPSARDVTFVFQQYSLYPHMSVFDNMAYGLKIRGVPKSEISVRRQLNSSASCRRPNCENLFIMCILVSRMWPL